jgi:hypothetical protein
MEPQNSSRDDDGEVAAALLILGSVPVCVHRSSQPTRNTPIKIQKKNPSKKRVRVRFRGHSPDDTSASPSCEFRVLAMVAARLLLLDTAATEAMFRTVAGCGGGEDLPPEFGGRSLMQLTGDDQTRWLQAVDNAGLRRDRVLDLTRTYVRTVIHTYLLPQETLVIFRTVELECLGVHPSRAIVAVLSTLSRVIPPDVVMAFVEYGMRPTTSPSMLMLYYLVIRDAILKYKFGEAAEWMRRAAQGP